MFFAYALLTLEERTVFTHADSMNAVARDHLRQSGVTVLQYDQVWGHLKTWGRELESKRQTASGQPESESPSMKAVDEEGKKNAKSTYKASLSGKSSWAVAEALGKVSISR